MQDFATKRNALFASLDDASKELKGTALDQSGWDTNTINILQRCGSLDSVYREEMENGSRHNRHSHKQNADKSLSRMRGKESIFKKPELPIGKCLKPRKTPDFQVNPHKWKKYTLSDVDISDQTNSSAAFEFLKAIDEQREAKIAALSQNAVDIGGDTAAATAPTDIKIEFKKSSIIKRQIKSVSSDELADSQVDTPKLKGSKFVMPEYVVGQNVSKKKKQAKGTTKKQNEMQTKQLHLAHLQEYEEEEDDDDNVVDGNNDP